MSAPAVSVIMPAYNGAALLPETIATLFAQRMTDWELIVVDDCSTDDTPAVLRGYGDPRIRVIALDVNLGPVGARNRAVAEARGRYVAGLDQDDLCHPDRFARQVAFLDANPGTVLAASAVALLEEGAVRPSRFPRGMAPDVIDWLLHVRNPLVWSSVMFRAEAARRLDPFERPGLRYAEDFDLYHRLRAFGAIAQIDAELLVYRSHAGGASQRFAAQMGASAGRVLEEAHVALLGAAVEVPLLLAHVMRREPVPDVATLHRLFAGVARLHAAWLDRYRPDPAARSALEASIRGLWRECCRTGLRAGTLPLRASFGAGGLPRWKGSADLLVSRLIGGVRALRG